MKYLTVALAKGRLATLAMDIFTSIGMDCSEMKEKSRKLVFTDEKNKMKFILVKASDVPTYVEYGAADIGVVGKALKDKPVSKRVHRLGTPSHSRAIVIFQPCWNEQTGIILLYLHFIVFIA